MNKDKNNFVETHRKGFRLLKVVKVLDRNLIPLFILQAVLGVVIPYVSIILSARVIDLLLNSSFKEAIQMAVIMIEILLITEILLAVISYYTDVSRHMLQDRLEILIRKKGMELDYHTMEDSEVLKALRNAESAAKYNGGLGELVRLYGELLKNLLNSVTAILLTVFLCISLPSSGETALRIFAHPVITAVCLIIAWYLGILLTKSQTRNIKKMEDEIAEKHYVVENQFSYWVFQILHNVESGKTIRVNGMADLLLANIKKFTKQSLPLFEAMGIAEGKRIRSEGLQSGLFTVVAYLLVLVKVLSNAITVGSFAQYTGALLQFNQASSKIVWSESEVNRIVKNLLPLVDFLERTNEMNTGSIHVEKRIDNVYELEFHDLGFCYPGSSEFSLRHVNGKLTLKEKMAIVGPNGAGKSTFIKLLCRLYDPTEGYISLNGIDIRKYDYKEYLGLFGVVFQNFHLFGASIHENVAVSQKYDKNLVEECLLQAGTLDFISNLPDGAATVINKGDETGIDLSGGQEQKISIARALYKNAPFVILDEPTAALDPISEAEIYERFHEMVKDKTSVYISHRMSSCRFCDKILVFDKGLVAEQGTHEELIDKKGIYHKLWNAQAQYYA